MIQSVKYFIQDTLEFLQEVVVGIINLILQIISTIAATIIAIVLLLAIVLVSLSPYIIGAIVAVLVLQAMGVI